MKNKFQGPPYPPKKANLRQTKAKMGRFSQKGLCYSFEKDIWGIPPTSPINPILTGKWGNLGEIDSANTLAGQFPLVPMGG